MPDAALPFLETWHRVVAERDLEGLASLLAPDVSLGAPPYWQRIEGAPTVWFLLGRILATIEGFTYHREWHDGSELALEFTGTVDGLELQGIDLVTLDAEGRIARLDVLMRPVNAVQALIATIAPQMQTFLAETAKPAASGTGSA